MKNGGLGTANFVAFYPFVAFFTLYHYILHSPAGSSSAEIERIEDDLILMEELGNVIEHLGQNQEEFFPIVNAVSALNKVCRHALEGKRRASASTSPSPWVGASQVSVNWEAPLGMRRIIVTGQAN